jgi:predicted deacetylase
MSTKYILRFDDIAPGMAWQKFLPIKTRLQAWGVRSVLGVVPECQDEGLACEPAREDFFTLIRAYKNYGDTIAQHGCFHRYSTNSAGLLGINQRSEFAGLSFHEQLELLSHGKDKLIAENVWEPYFMAPAHSLDEHTLDALRQLEFHAITDGYGFFPYVLRGIKLVPQLTASPFNIGFGYCTICVHVNTASEQSLVTLMNFIERNKAQFVDFKDVVALPVGRSLLSPFMRWMTRMTLQMLRMVRRVSVY